MAGDSLYEIDKGTYKVVLVVDDEQLDSVDDVDAFVYLPDGSKWSATFMTLGAIERLLRKWSLTGECLGGIFFRCPDLVITREPGVPAMMEVIEALMARTADRLEDVFQGFELDDEGFYDEVERPTPPVAASDHPHTVETDTFTVMFMLDARDDPAAVSDVGAVLELADRSRWAARFMTPDAITRLLEQPQLTGEHLGGRYFQDWNLVIVTDAGIPAMTDLIRCQVEGDEEPVWANYRRLSVGP